MPFSEFLNGVERKVAIQSTKSTKEDHKSLQLKINELAIFVIQKAKEEFSSRTIQ
jgi:hypothetical protein